MIIREFNSEQWGEFQILEMHVYTDNNKWIGNLFENIYKGSLDLKNKFRFINYDERKEFESLGETYEYIMEKYENSQFRSRIY